MRTRLADDVAALGTRFRSASHVPVACARVHVRIRLFVRFLAFSLQFIAANRVIFIENGKPTARVAYPRDFPTCPSFSEYCDNCVLYTSSYLRYNCKASSRSLAHFWICFSTFSRQQLSFGRFILRLSISVSSCPSRGGTNRLFLFVERSKPLGLRNLTCSTVLHSAD